jgi:hypothetical protein
MMRMATYRQTGKMAVNVPATFNLPNPDVLNRLVISKSGFIFDPILGKSYNTNNTGLIILKKIQSGSNLDQIIGEITKEFGVTREEAERDIIEFIQSLQGQMR